MEIRLHCIKCGEWIESKSIGVLNLPLFLTFILKCEHCKLEYMVDYTRDSNDVKIEDY